MLAIPSPAVSIVGRHNSGKTTLIEQLITKLVSYGVDVGSVKHHSHVGFDIDIPGKDSFRHRAAGACETVISAPGQMARIKTIEGELECSQIVADMPGHDLVLVEGYRKSGLPTIEIMRANNPADTRVAEVFSQAACKGLPLGIDFTQHARRTDTLPPPAGTPLAKMDSTLPGDAEYAYLFPNREDISNKLPTAHTVAIVTDIEQAQLAATRYGIPFFALNDISGLAQFLLQTYARPHVSVVIQAGGESRRMGRSKATVPFAGRPLICRLIERLAPVADELVITTNEAENLLFLYDEYPLLPLTFSADLLKTRGALPGLYTALHTARGPYVAVVACDMVFASPSLIVSEACALTESGADVVVPVNKHGFEPFHALYRRDSCLPALRAALQRDDRRAQAFYPDVKVVEFSQDKVLAAEPSGGCFINANTPEELRALERSLKKV